MGYYPFLSLVTQQLSRNTQKKIESNIHDIGGNMIIKMPMSLPYGPDSNEYQPISGEITYQDTVYQFIKQRFYQDTLYVVCIRDYHTTEAKGKVVDYLKSLSSQNKQEDNSLKIVASLAKYFFPTTQSVYFLNAGYATNFSFSETVASCYFYDPNRDIFHPPRIV